MLRSTAARVSSGVGFHTFNAWTPLAEYPFFRSTKSALQNASPTGHRAALFFVNHPAPDRMPETVAATAAPDGRLSCPPNPTKDASERVARPWRSFKKLANINQKNVQPQKNKNTKH